MKEVISKADGKVRQYSDAMADYLVKTGRASLPRKEEKSTVETKEEKHKPKTKAKSVKKSNVKK